MQSQYCFACRTVPKTVVDFIELNVRRLKCIKYSTVYMYLHFVSAVLCNKISLSGVFSTLLQRAIAKGRYVCPSVCHTRKPRLRSSR